MFSQEPQRSSPNMGASDYKTYAISSPISTHTKLVSCEEAECPAFQNGWITRVDISTPLGKEQSEYIESKVHGRAFTQMEDGSIVGYRFPAGQQCFAAPHGVALERPAFFVVRGGDWRGNPRGEPTQQLSVDNWVDDFATHQSTLRDQIDKG